MRQGARHVHFLSLHNHLSTLRKQYVAEENTVELMLQVKTS